MKESNAYWIDCAEDLRYYAELVEFFDMPNVATNLREIALSIMTEIN